MTPRERVEISLHGGHSDRVPFTIYKVMIPQCSAEREMRNRGLCIMHDFSVFTVHRPNVNMYQHIYWEGKKQFRKTFYETPAGNLSTLSEFAGFTSWRHEAMFKKRDDYKAILFLIQDERYEENYDAFALAEKTFGGDAIFRAAFGSLPLNSMISGDIMKMQDFCIEWMDNRDEILKLYDATVENRRRVYPLVAKSPALHANYSGNIVSEVIGLETFEKYYVQHYNEAAEVMHQHGKLIGSHFDGNCKLLSKAIADTDLDYIEAFTPAPDTDMGLAEARSAWPDKVLWINFPSSLHLKSDTEIESVTVDLLTQAKTTDGLIVGITEDIPSERWQNSCRAIMDGLDRYCKIGRVHS